jgi:hypothetical protein
VFFLQAELKTDMHAGLTAADRRELAQLQPALEGLTKDLAAAKKARNQVRAACTCGTAPFYMHEWQRTSRLSFDACNMVTAVGPTPSALTAPCM